MCPPTTVQVDAGFLRCGILMTDGVDSSPGYVGIAAVAFDYAAPAVPTTSTATVVGMASTPDGNGYWLAWSNGQVTTYGDALDFGDASGIPLNSPIAHIVATSDGYGYWLVAGDGGTFAFGDAPFYGSMGGFPLNRPVVDLAPTPDGGGYWLVASDGGIFAFGDAAFHGSMGGQALNRPVVGLSAAGPGGGYWEVASDGGIFAFGAPFHGSTGDLPLNKPINGMAATNDFGGYLFVASDGGVFAFGDAVFSGSTGALALNAPMVGMAIDPATDGYWLVAADGGVFALRSPVLRGAVAGPAPAEHPAGSVRRVIDLHTHSDRSDGSEQPGRIVELAHDVGCGAVALTDHDTLAGLPEARLRAEELGIRLVPGCEVSCLPIAGGGVHVLVYFVDDPRSPLGTELARLRDDRRTRNEALAGRLQQLGIPVTVEAAAAHAGTVEGVGRPHFARAMVDIGAVASLDEAFARYLGNGGEAYVPKGRLTVADVCGLARDSGGVAVLAHPHTVGLAGDALAAAVADMAAAGLAGLEAVYGRYTPRQRTDLANLARRFGLVPTGGSDYHGVTKPDLHVGTGSGDLKVPDRVLDQLEATRPVV